jgi:hypothetical protein
MLAFLLKGHGPWSKQGEDMFKKEARAKITKQQF